MESSNITSQKHFKIKEYWRVFCINFISYNQEQSLSNGKYRSSNIVVSINRRRVYKL